MFKYIYKHTETHNVYAKKELNFDKYLECCFLCCCLISLENEKKCVRVCVNKAFEINFIHPAKVKSKIDIDFNFLFFLILRVSVCVINLLWISMCVHFLSISLATTIDIIMKEKETVR